MSEMTIGKKLMLGFAAVLVVALGLAGAYLYSVEGLGGELKEATDVTGKKTFMVSELQGDLFRMRGAQRGVMLYSLAKAADRAQSNKQDFEARAANVETVLGELKPLLVSEKARQDVGSMQTELPQVKGYFEQIATASMSGDSNGAMKINQEHSIASFDSLDVVAADLIEIQKQLMRASSERGASVSSRAHWMAYAFLLAALVLSPFVLLLILRTTRQLRSVAANLAEGAEQITSASSQVASSSQTLAQGASEQAASLEETSASSEEITSMTRKNAENSQSAASVMTEVDQRVTEGNRTLEQMVQSMQEITGSSDKISKIIKVIDEIAFQTNILALNAAVEAARAGEAGMGFAVVADEVRSLAQRSAQAAKDTAALIEESIGKSNEGSQRLEHVATVIRAITESASKVKTLVDEVNLGSQEQARGIQQISQSIAEMDRVTQANAASAEQSASASEEMSAQAEALQTIARELRTLVGGGDESSHMGRHSTPPAARTQRSTLMPVLPKTRDLAALRSAVTPAQKNKPQTSFGNGTNTIPIEDDFVNM
jgi:methyl-accepting chemotaxis protein